MGQKEQIIEYCQEHGSITPMEAVNNLGCMRLAARMAEIRENGWSVTAQRVEGRNRNGRKVYYMRYSIKPGVRGDV